MSQIVKVAYIQSSISLCTQYITDRYNCSFIQKYVYIYAYELYITLTIDLFTPPLPPPPYVAESTASVSSCLR